MGGSNSKNAGLSADSTNANKSIQNGVSKNVTEPRGNFSAGITSYLDYRLASGIIRNLRVDANKIFEYVVHLTVALRALRVQDYEAFNLALDALRKLGLDISSAAKVALAMMKEHTWETAAIIIPFVLSVFTPAILSAAGFTAGGIAAGSIAAGIQAGIGNVATGSAFAILTSAGMSGFGLPIVLGGVLITSGTVLWSIAALRRWWRRKE